MQHAEASKSGYYTVFVVTEKAKLPYTVFALSDYHAARIVNQETGYLASQYDVEGPFTRAW